MPDGLEGAPGPTGVEEELEVAEDVEVVSVPDDFDVSSGDTPEDVPDEHFSDEASESDKTVGEVALEVVEGKWGDGQERRAALSDAGFNPNEVQEAVHALIRDALIRDKDQPSE